MSLTGLKSERGWVPLEALKNNFPSPFLVSRVGRHPMASMLRANRVHLCDTNSPASILNHSCEHIGCSWVMQGALALLRPADKQPVSPATLIPFTRVAYSHVLAMRTGTFFWKTFKLLITASIIHLLEEPIINVQ